MSMHHVSLEQPCQVVVPVPPPHSGGQVDWDHGYWCHPMKQGEYTYLGVQLHTLPPNGDSDPVFSWITVANSDHSPYCYQLRMKWGEKKYVVKSKPEAKTSRVLVTPGTVDIEDSDYHWSAPITPSKYDDSYGMVPLHNSRTPLVGKCLRKEGTIIGLVFIDITDTKYSKLAVNTEDKYNDSKEQTLVYLPTRLHIL